MKRYIAIILMICLLMSMTGCDVNMDENQVKTIKIGISVYDQYDTFVTTLMDSLNKWAKEKENETGIVINIDIVNAAGSQTTQNDQVDSFVEKRYDVICINLVDRTDTSMIIDKAKNADIPVIFFNRELVEEDLERWDKLYYVGAPAAESGKLEGEIVVDLCNENFENVDKNGDGVIQYIMLEGEAGHQDALLRTEYSVETIVKGGYKVEKLANEAANWKRAQAQSKMTKLLDSFGDNIELVICNNDDMALGAIDVLEKRDDIDMPIVVGIDGHKEALLTIQEGSLSGTVYNDNVGQARAILELAYSLVTNEDMPEDIEIEDGKFIRLPYQMVTPKNVNEYLEEE